MSRLSSLEVHGRRILLTFCILFFAELFTGCCPCKKLATEHDSTSQQSDSTSTTIHERIVEVHDTIPFYIPVESSSSVGQQNSHLETSVAYSDAYIDSTGALHHTIDNKAQEVQKPIVVYVPVADTSHYESHESENTTNDKEVEYIEKPLKWWQEGLMKIGSLAILAWVAFAIIKIRKRRLS